MKRKAIIVGVVAALLLVAAAYLWGPSSALVVRQFVVPNLKRISFCLAQALRFGIAG
jgi:hypothetical protein